MCGGKIVRGWLYCYGFSKYIGSDLGYYSGVHSQCLGFDRLMWDDGWIFVTLLHQGRRCHMDKME